MIEYLLVSSAFSAIALIGSLLLRSTPPRVNMWVCLIAMGALTIPWHTVSIGWAQPVLAVYSTWLPEPSSPGVPLYISSGLNFQWSWILWLATALGLAVFLFRWINLARLLGRWRVTAKPAGRLWQDHGFTDESIPIRVVSDFDNAFVSGYFRSEIWLGGRQAASPAIGSILRHERIHIEQHDNFVLLIATLLRDLFWWNPLVWLLSVRVRQYMELSCDQRCQENSPSYQDEMARQLLDARNASRALGLMTPLFLTRRFNVYRIRQLDKEFSLKKRHFGLLSLMGLLAASAAIAATIRPNPDVSTIVNHLTVTTTPNEQDRSTTVVEFIGEPEVRKLLELAEEHDVSAASRMEKPNRRVISLASRSHDDMYSVLTAFDGTPMEFFFRKEVVTELGEPLLVDLVFTENGGEPFQVTLASTTGQWTGISTGDYQLRVRPTLIPNRDREDVGFWVEVSERVDGRMEVVARPRVVTPLEDVATIKSGNDQSTIVLTLKARKAG